MTTPGPPQIDIMSEFETLAYSESNRVATITLNRPEVYNSFNEQMQRELRSLWHQLRLNHDVGAVVLTGAGTKAFCTGIDRNEAMSEGVRDNADGDHLVGYSDAWSFDDPGEWLCPKANGMWKPVIGAVNGMACGGAFYMLGECDFLLAADHATFFDPHVTFGMTAAYEPIHLLSKMPFGELMRMSLLGSHEQLSARRALEIGFVTEVCPSEELLERATWCAERIAESPNLATMGTVKALWTGLELSRRQALDMMYLFTNVGTDAELIAEGQRKFTSGERIRPRIR